MNITRTVTKPFKLLTDNLDYFTTIIDTQGDDYKFMFLDIQKIKFCM